MFGGIQNRQANVLQRQCRTETSWLLPQTTKRPNIVPVNIRWSELSRTKRPSCYWNFTNRVKFYANHIDDVASYKQAYVAPRWLGT